MAEPRFTPEAEEDVAQIVAHISKDSLQAALSWLDEIKDLCLLLARQPGIGKQVWTRQHGNLRRIAKGNYYFYYLPTIHGIDIVRVLHAARQQDDLV